MFTVRDPSQPATRNLEVAGRQVTDSLAVLLTIAATKATTTPAYATTAASMIGADSTRVGLVIVNSNTVAALFLAFNGATATVVSPVSVPPLGAYVVTTAQLNGAVSGIWAAGGIGDGGASVTAYTA